MYTKSFLRWAGSKRKSIGRLKEHWSDTHKRYLEPFAGSASLFFEIKPKKAILSDANNELIATLKCVRDNPVDIFNCLRVKPISSSYYYTIRSIKPESLDTVQRAARFIYLNRFCFNGIYRTNRNGGFNVPYSGDKTGRKPTLSHLQECSRILKSAEIVSGDFQCVVMSQCQKGDFVYLDPPYVTDARRIFKEYTPGTFSLPDLARLQLTLQEIDQRGAKFVMSYAYCPEALKFFKGWSTDKHFVQRNVSGFAKHRRTAAEILVTNK